MATTTLKLDACEFSEMKIYPGRGVRCITKDGKLHMFISQRTANLFHARRKAAKLRWTIAWRRLNHKLHNEQVVVRKRARRTARIEKAVAGMSLEEMKKAAASIKRAPVVPGAKEAALKEAKSRREAQQKLVGKAAGLKGQGAGAKGAGNVKQKKVQAARPQIRHN